MRRRRRPDPAQVTLDALLEAEPAPVSDRSDTGEVLLALMPHGAAIGAAFRRMAIAEDVLRLHVAPGIVFRACVPSPVLTEYGSDILYRAHVVELVQRFKRGESPVPGTKAEVVAGLMLTGLRAPLRSGALALVVSLLEDIAPEIVARGDWPDREEWPGQLREQFVAAQRRLAQADRLFGPPDVGSSSCDSETSGSRSTSTCPAPRARRARSRSTT